MRIIIRLCEYNRALRQETVPQSLPSAVQTQHVHRHDIRAMQRHQAVHRAHKRVRAAAPAHYFGNRQFFDGGVDDFAQQRGKRLPRLGKFVRVHILLAIVDDFQAADFHTARAGETFQSLGGHAVFHARRHGNAFAHNVLVCLHRLHICHRNRKAARRSVGGVLRCAVNQLRFFQAFGNGLGKVVAQVVEGFWGEFFG